MCRNIKTLYNFAPPATGDEVRASALQFVRKLSGFTHPSKANEAVFNRAVDEVTHIAHHLIEDLVTNAPPRDRGTEAAKAREKARERYGVAPAQTTPKTSRRPATPASVTATARVPSRRRTQPRSKP